MRVLNLYAGIGGNRALWPTDAQITAVELDPEIAQAYACLWPDDEMVITDAHQYLLNHLLDGWDFIWASPPCPTHSRLNRFGFGKGQLRYPELDQLYGEIILLTQAAPKPVKWVIENVIAYYTPLIPPTAALGRHWYWSNFPLPTHVNEPRPRIAIERKSAYKAHKRTLSPMEAADTHHFEQTLGITLPACTNTWDRLKRRQTMRNCVDPRTGLTIYQAAQDQPNPTQDPLFTDTGAMA